MLYNNYTHISCGLISGILFKKSVLEGFVNRERHEQTLIAEVQITIVVPVVGLVFLVCSRNTNALWIFTPNISFSAAKLLIKHFKFDNFLFQIFVKMLHSTIYCNFGLI